MPRYTALSCDVGQMPDIGNMMLCRNCQNALSN
jgi:hypothetical protein